MSGAADVARAVTAAKAAFPGWRDTPIKERVQVLFRLKALLERDLEELAWLVSHENGKVIGEARADVLKGIECLEYGISLQNMVAGEQLDVSRGINCSVTHEPLGVCAGIVPFNFPMGAWSCSGCSRRRWWRGTASSSSRPRSSPTAR